MINGSTGTNRAARPVPVGPNQKVRSGLLLESSAGDGRQEEGVKSDTKEGWAIQRCSGVDCKVVEALQTEMAMSTL